MRLLALVRPGLARGHSVSCSRLPLLAAWTTLETLRLNASITDETGQRKGGFVTPSRGNTPRGQVLNSVKRRLALVNGIVGT